MICVSKYGETEETREETGLVTKHAYSITKIVRAEIKTFHLIQLIRIRNPYGNATEWKGAWSDGSKEWEDLPVEQREQLGLTFGHIDGEFWMSLKDFMKQFDREGYTSRDLQGQTMGG